VEFSSKFGDLYHHVLGQYNSTEFPELLTVSNERKEGGENKGVDAEYWHSDLSYMAEPPLGSCLVMLKCPPPGADGNTTLYANM